MDDVREDLNLESQDQDFEMGGPVRDEQEVTEERSVQGNVHIAEDVITELARKTLTLVPGVQPASPGLVSKLGLVGRKAIDGIKVSVEENINPPQITVDVFVLVKYGLRIPDIAWDLQEAVKNNLEQYTGYTVKAVNVNVQGVFFHERSVQSVNADTDKNVVKEQVVSVTETGSETEADAESK